jgi:hypothetical protein
MTDEEMRVIQKCYSRLSQPAHQDENLQQSHSIEEADEIHEIKKEAGLESPSAE